MSFVRNLWNEGTAMAAGSAEPAGSCPGSWDEEYRPCLPRKKWEASLWADFLRFQRRKILHSSVLNCLIWMWVETIGNSLALMVPWQVLQVMTKKLPLDSCFWDRADAMCCRPVDSVFRWHSLGLSSHPCPLLMSSPSTLLLSTVSKLYTYSMLEGWDGRRTRL